MNVSALHWGLYFSATPAIPHSPDAPAPAPRHPEPAASPPKGPGWTMGLLLILVGGAIGAITWNATRNGPSAAQSSIATVPTAQATIGTFENTLRVGGTIGAKRFGAIRTPRLRGPRDAGRSGLTLMKMAEGGTVVQAGDVVSEFEVRWLIDHVDDRQSSVVQAESNVEKRRAEIMIARETLRQTLKAAEAEREKAKLDLRTAEVRSEIEAAILELAVKETAAAATQLVEETEIQEVSHQADLRSMEILVEKDQYHLERHQRDLERLRLKTPVGGLVVIESIYRGNAQFGQVRNGDMVNPGTFFMRVVDLSSMVLSGSVNQVDVQSVRMGQKCEVRLDAYPELALSGHVSGMGALATAAGGSRFRRGSSGTFVKVVSIEVAIDEADKRVIPDLSGSADIIFERQENALLVPRSAIQENDDDTTVFVRVGDQFVERPVKLGKISSTKAVVLDGLAEGDEVALQMPPQQSDT